MNKIEVCFTPAMLDYYDISESVVVVIDIFRATSSICYGIENGALEILPVATLEECISYQNKGYILAAERDGEVVKGFDFGNSPFAYTAEKVKDKRIVLTTTNGTQAIETARKAHKIIIGSFLNLSAVSQFLISQNRNILLLCAGWKNKFNLEDTLFAGAVIDKMSIDCFVADDAGIAALTLFQQAKNDLRGFLKQSSHSIRLEELNIEEDIQFCLNIDICATVPALLGNKITALNNLSWKV